MNQLRRLIILASSLILTSCSLSPVQSRPINKYTITGKLKQYQSPRSKSCQVSDTLLVMNTVVQPEYQGEQMYYMQKLHQLEAYSQNMWAAPPADMLQTLLAQKLHQAHYFAHVTTPPFSGNYRYVLRTHLLILRQEFFKPVSRVRLAMRAEIIDKKRGCLLSSRTFQVIEKARGNNPYSGAAAANRAASKLSGRISWFTRQVVKRDKSS